VIVLAGAVLAVSALLAAAAVRTLAGSVAAVRVPTVNGGGGGGG